MPRPELTPRSSHSGGVRWVRCSAAAVVGDGQEVLIAFAPHHRERQRGDVAAVIGPAERGAVTAAIGRWDTG